MAALAGWLAAALTNWILVVALRSFPDLPMSLLEGAERLEQLRWLEAGLQVQTFEVSPQPPSVDTPADLERVRELFLARSGA